MQLLVKEYFHLFIKPHKQLYGKGAQGNSSSYSTMHINIPFIKIY